MKVAILASRHRPLAAFRASLEGRSARIETFFDPWALLEAARTSTWNLVVVDSLSAPFPGFLEDLLAVNARLNTAVLTDLAPEAFHEAAEGMGILCALPSNPAAADVALLMDQLQAAGGLDLAVEAAQIRLDLTRMQRHPHCVVCWDRHPFGLQVDYRVTGRHAVAGVFACGKSYEGTENIIHGGIVSSLLEGAMTSCLLAMGIDACTADLRVQFRCAVRTGTTATIRGEWLRGMGPTHQLSASLTQDGQICATAWAKCQEGEPPKTDCPLLAEPGVSGRQRQPHT